MKNQHTLNEEIQNQNKSQYNAAPSPGPRPLNFPVTNFSLSLSAPALLFSLFFTLNSLSAAAWQPAAGPLKTRWAKDVSPRHAHPEYPRPQLVRKDWLNLNGL